LNSAIVRQAIEPETRPQVFDPLELPTRPPNMCAGCPHRGLFYGLSKMKDVFISGDIGCYTLGCLPPLSAMDSTVCMGASITIAHGMDKALGEEGAGKVVAVLGDSTFLHSGITGLLNAVYNDSHASVIILDNRITAMTGHQENPASGRNIFGAEAPAVDLEALCRSLGVKQVVVVNPHDIEATRKVLKAEIERPEPSVIISRAPCVLLPEEVRRKKSSYRTEVRRCVGCTACVQLGCPAISWHPLSSEQTVVMGYKAKQKGYARITEVHCNGCGQCACLCKFEAIGRKEEVA
jgi:indolepyruvate ferredoxin oxidoreductase, alpha subunit